MFLSGFRKYIFVYRIEANSQTETSHMQNKRKNKLYIQALAVSQQKKWEPI